MNLIINKTFTKNYKFTSLESTQNHLDTCLNQLNESSEITLEKRYLKQPFADFSKQLKLAYIKNNYGNHIKETLDLSDSYESFLEKLLQAELENRQSNRIQTLVRASNLPSKTTFDD